MLTCDDGIGRWYSNHYLFIIASPVALEQFLEAPAPGHQLLGEPVPEASAPIYEDLRRDHLRQVEGAFRHANEEDRVEFQVQTLHLNPHNHHQGTLAEYEWDDHESETRDQWQRVH